MTALTFTFTIDFHGPLMPATGTARGGFDATVDLSEPLRATALKGVMRSAARDLLALRGEVVDEVFGTRDTASPWHWVVTAQPELAPAERNRVQIDPETHAAKDDALVRMQVGHALSQAAFAVETDGLPDHADPDLHAVVIRASACAVFALGGQRRRGLGWVSVRPESGSELTGDDYARLLSVRQEVRV